MFFIFVLILTALSLASAAAYFSVYGLGQIFAGAFWPVVVMGCVLEGGKLVAASFLYRYWKQLSFVMRSYLLLAVIVLMVVTSMGVFGFLSTAYQQDILPWQLKKQQITLLEQEKDETTRLREERIARKQQIDQDIANLPNDFVTGRKRLLDAFGPELERLKKDIEEYAVRLQSLNAEIYTLKNATLVQEAHIGPVVFIAKAFDRSTDVTTTWMIILIIFAFDPLAVMLTIGANLAVIDRQKRIEAARQSAIAQRDAIFQQERLQAAKQKQAAEQHEAEQKARELDRAAQVIDKKAPPRQAAPVDLAKARPRNAQRGGGAARTPSTAKSGPVVNKTAQQISDLLNSKLDHSKAAAAKPKLDVVAKKSGTPQKPHSEKKSNAAKKRWNLVRAPQDPAEKTAK